MVVFFYVVHYVSLSCLSPMKEGSHSLPHPAYWRFFDCGCLELFIFLGAHGRGSVTCHGWHISVGWRVWSAFSKHTSLAHPVMCIQFQTTCKPWNYKNAWSFVVIIQNVLETCLRNFRFHKLSKHLWTCIWLPFVLLPNTPGQKNKLSHPNLMPLVEPTLLFGMLKEVFKLLCEMSLVAYFFERNTFLFSKDAAFDNNKKSFLCTKQHVRMISEGSERLLKIQLWPHLSQK